MGKSTLAHAWRQRGGPIFADDAIPFRMEEGRTRIHAIPFEIRLRPASREFFGVPATVEEAPLSPQEPHRPILRFLDRIYLLDRRVEMNGDVTIEPVAPEVALPALLHQAYCLTLRDRQRNSQMVETYMALVNRLTTYQLSYPTGLNHLDPILDRLFDHVMAAEAQAHGEE
jgi:hypothetical protein